MRTIEQELEEERKLRNAAVQAKKKAESDLNELESQIESAMKGKDDFARQLKKAHVSFYFNLSVALLLCFTAFQVK